jgi:DNA-binding IclR family transcriptional regulator
MLESRPSSTSLDKALEICETLSRGPRGMSLAEVARAVRHPAPTVHRLLGVLRRRGYVRQDEESLRYSLSLKMLDLSFVALGRSELRLHAYPVLREYVLRTSERCFIAIPSTGEVTYIWSAGTDEVKMRTVYGKKIGPPSTEGDGLQRLLSASAPVYDYSAREVACVGIFRHHGTHDPELAHEHARSGRELARLISLRLGHLTPLGVTA